MAAEVPEPTMMNACLASKFGKPDDVLIVGEAPRPALSEKHLQIKVDSCSLSPGDYRALLGEKQVVCVPKAWPYIPGGDVSGIVEYCPEEFQGDFQVGDRVMATWEIWGLGGLAEYANVLPGRTVKLPESIAFVEGAALANSSSHAYQAIVRAYVQPGERVLVIGGSGGVGTLVVQLLKKRFKADYVGAVSTDTKLMDELGVNKTVNYKETNWWEDDEWTKEKFDAVIDCAVGAEAWEKAPMVLKGAGAGGRFVAVVLNEWDIDGTEWLKVIGFLLQPLGRQLYNTFRRSTPYYRMYIGEPSQGSMEALVEMAAKQEFKVIVDPESPYPFTTEGVRAAWNKHILRAGHGKIVIQISKSS